MHSLDINGEEYLQSAFENITAEQKEEIADAIADDDEDGAKDLIRDTIIEYLDSYIETMTDAILQKLIESEEMATDESRSNGQDKGLQDYTG